MNEGCHFAFCLSSHPNLIPLATQAGVSGVAFAYEATIAAGTLATTAAVFYQKPSQRSARLLFRFSLLFLPVFMAGMVAHRVPNDHSVTLTSLRQKLSAGVRLRDDDLTQPGPGEWPIRELSAVPFPFLPVPFQLEMTCPAKVSCEGDCEREREEIERSSSDGDSAVPACGQTVRGS